MNNYIILKAWDSFGLMEDVNKKIEDGYVPFGNLIYKTNREAGLNHDTYIQAMILKDDKENNTVL